MQDQAFASGQAAYRPTSLDFINRPNPVEPHTDPHQHPLHTGQGHLRLLHDTNVSNLGSVAANSGSQPPPRKRRKSGDGQATDPSRPTLPAVRQQGEKRLRIPPTLSGLHQPPPDAGILPPISIDGLRTVELPERTGQSQKSAEKEQSDGAANAVGSSEQVASEAQGQAFQGALLQPAGDVADGVHGVESMARKNKKWTDVETKSLLQGVARHGIGKWTKILQDPSLSFQDHRKPLDLKDRFRICCPDQYRTSESTDIAQDPSAIDEPEEPTKQKRARTTHRKTPAELNDLGIVETFAKSGRRQRTGYSEAEDEAILEGFRQYRNKWVKIHKDQSLGLESRSPTDLRDRMRNRWPEEYAKAGLALGAAGAKKSKGEQIRKSDAGRSTQHDEIQQAQPSATNTSNVSATVEKPGAARTEKENKEPSTTAAPPPKKVTAPAPFLSQADDVFWGLPLDADEERITLDRRILDWPSNPSASTSAIDSLPSLNLPRPNALPSLPTSGTAFPTSAAATLPSLAAVTASSGGYDFEDQLELPSLLEGFGASDGDGGDGRAGTGLMMPSLDEILG